MPSAMFTPYPPSNSPDDDLNKKDTNWCQTVRESCLRYYQEQADDEEKRVTISSLKLQEMAQDIAQTSNNEHDQKELVTWDEEEWHYTPPNHWSAHVRRERIALYILAVDAVNFCFWPYQSSEEEKRYEYSDLATNLTQAAEEDHAQQELTPNEVSTGSYALSATHLASMTVERVQQILLRNGKTLSLLEERCRLWKEVGRVLLEHFQGSAWNLIQQANGSPVQAVTMLVEFFPGFRDCQPSCAFLKRAQICVGDWQAALGLEEWKDEMKALTAFADYRLPQLLRERGVMEYHPALAERVDAREEIPSNSPAEWAIRAATVVVVDELVQCLNRLNADKEWTAVSVDWYLWQLGEQLNEKGELKPHHRVLTTFY